MERKKKDCDCDKRSMSVVIYNTDIPRRFTDSWRSS